MPLLRRRVDKLWGKEEARRKTDQVDMEFVADTHCRYLEDVTPHSAMDDIGAPAH